MKIRISCLSVVFGMALVCASFALSPETAPTGETTPATQTTPQAAYIAPVNATSTQAPEVTAEPEWITAEATAYCPCETCCGVWAQNRPDGIVYTASGAVAQEGVTIAADWDVYPPGTIIYIEGIGERTVQDSGGAITGQAIDIYFESHDDALQFGRQQVRIYTVEGA